MEDFLNNAWKGVVEHWLVIASVSSAILMAIFRTAKNHGKIDWLEAGMCGLFSYSIWFVLSWFNVPEGAGVIIGATIGYRGTHFVSDWLLDKFCLENKEDSKNKE